MNHRCKAMEKATFSILDEENMLVPGRDGEKQVLIEERSDGKFELVFRIITSAPGGVLENFRVSTVISPHCPFCRTNLKLEKELKPKSVPMVPFSNPVM